MEEALIPAPRDFGCPACLDKESLFFSSIYGDDTDYVICQRDNWRGNIRSIQYEQFFIKKSEKRYRNRFLALTSIIILFISLMVALPQFFPSTPQVIISKTITITNWTLNITQIQNATQLPIAEVFIKMQSPENSTTLPSISLFNMTSGDYLRGVSFTNCIPLDYLNTGDSFTLNISIHPIGSLLQLTDESGAVVYCSYKLSLKGI